MADVDKLKKIRTAYRGHVTRVEKDIQTALVADELDAVRLHGLKKSYTDKIEKIKELDSKIMDLVTEDLFEAELDAQLTYHEGSYQLLATLDSKTAPPAPSTPATPPNPTPVTSPSPMENRTKLPRLVVKSFDGKILQWQSFWDQFSSAVHRRSDLSDIDKFNYLKSLLTGRAEEVIGGLSLSSDNYVSAIDLLKERFGNKQTQINAYMEQMLRITPVKTMNNVGGLRKLFDNIESSIRNLDALNVKAETYGSLLIPLISEKLPDELKLVIGRNFKGDVWNINAMMKHFKDELLVNEACSSNVTKEEKSQPLTCSSFYNTSGQKRNEPNKCLFCKLSSHPTFKCRKVTDVNSRINILRKSGRCFRCLETGHMVKTCTSEYMCKICNGKHNITLCTSRERKPPESDESLKPLSKETKEKDAQTPVTIAATPTKNRCNILMMTARSDVHNPQTMERCSARILFDTGSQRTYITNEIKSKLNLKTARKERIILNTFGNEASKACDVDIVHVKFVTKYVKKEVSIEAMCVPLICPKLHNQRTIEVARKFRMFDELYLADFSNEDEKGGKKVDILVGKDSYNQFMTGNSKLGGKNESFAIETLCGWLISGADYSNSVSEVHTYVLTANVGEADEKLMCMPTHDVNDELKSSLGKFWAVESVPEKLNGGEEKEKSDFVSKFENDITFDGRRYSVKLPFKPYAQDLPDNYSLAAKRLEFLMQKLNKNKNLKNEYNNIILDYKEKGIIETVTDDHPPPPIGSVHYMSHHAVCKENRETTKVRIVFDASAQANRNESSLNDNLYTGPCMLPYIFDILLRFRIGKIALVADIKQAFLQIEVAEEHRDFLRFLWLRDPSDPLSEREILRFCRVVFGLNCSPFLLSGTVHHHMKQYSIEYEGKSLTSKFLKDLYVDDTSNSFHEMNMVREFYQTVKECMAKGGFNLCKWESNCEELRNCWSELEINPTDKSQRKVLGIHWDAEGDRFVYKFDEILAQADKLRGTKRNVLKIAAMFYDPLGLLSPVTLQSKLIFKKLCLDKLEWDVKPTDEISQKWKKVLEEMKNVKYEINRHVQVENDEDETIEIHGFADASIQAYAAAVYIRVIKQSSVNMTLLTAKSKVAPMKELSVPRLELLSCLLLSKLVKSVIAAFANELSVQSVVCWTDSEIAYYWITQIQKEWHTWVENRVNQIRGIIPPNSWRHVPGSNNPADLATRELNPKKLIDNTLWWHGPDFLQSNESQWPEIPPISAISTNLELKMPKPGARKITQVLLNSTNQPCIDISKLIDIERFSSLDKLLRVTSYVLRFVRKMKQAVYPEAADELNPENDDEITTYEVNHAEKLWILSEQSVLKSDQKFCKREKSLRLYQDEGLLRSKTRISEDYALKFNSKHPIMLRDGSQFTKLLVWRAHKNVKHLKVDATLNDVRKDYWIIRGRQVVKQTLRRCVPCNKFNQKTLLPPPTPDLPKYRVSYEVPFEVAGIDYAGPVYAKSMQGTMTKCYILLITCAATRCVHLELTSDLSSGPLILALRRFTARRGLSKLFISDNFKTFKSRDVKAYLRSNNIKWQFIMDKAPNWGGFYERLIGLTKMCLKKTIGNARLTYEELNTVLVEIENVINSRPLTYLSDENFQCSLTPHHLVFGRNINEKYVSSPIEPLITADEARGRVEHLRTILHHFQSRFYHEYVTALRERHQYVRTKSNDGCPIKVGDVVLIKQDVIPRIRWKNGRIEELISGADGLVRGAVLRTYQKKSGKTHLINRPLQQLIPLEISDATSIDPSSIDSTSIDPSSIDPTSNDNKATNERDANSDTSRDTTLHDELHHPDTKIVVDSSDNSSNTQRRRGPRRQAALNADLLRKLRV